MSARPGEIASYMQDFERKKHTLDLEEIAKDKRDIRLHGDEETVTMGIPLRVEDLEGPSEIALGPGLALLQEYYARLLKMNSSFAVLFCGGTTEYIQARRCIEDGIEKLTSDAAALGLTVAAGFLEDHEQAW